MLISKTQYIPYMYIPHLQTVDVVVSAYQVLQNFSLNKKCPETQIKTLTIQVHTDVHLGISYILMSFKRIFKIYLSI